RLGRGNGGYGRGGWPLTPVGVAIGRLPSSVCREDGPTRCQTAVPWLNSCSSELAVATAGDLLRRTPPTEENTGQAQWGNDSHAGGGEPEGRRREDDDGRVDRCGAARARPARPA